MSDAAASVLWWIDWIEGERLAWDRLRRTIPRYTFAEHMRQNAVSPGPMMWLAEHGGKPGDKPDHPVQPIEAA